MAIRLKSKDLITIHQLSREEVSGILEKSKEMKILHKRGEDPQVLKGKILAMIFQKTSTRTRVSFEAGIYQLGGAAQYLSAAELQLGRGETIADTARVLSRYVDGIMARTYSHEDLLTLAKYSTVPVINGLTDLTHPCQALADLFTIEEKKGKLRGLKLAYVGDGNNVAHSLLYGCAKTGMHIAVATPSNFEPNRDIVKNAREDAKETGSTITITKSWEEAVHDADVLYTDVWISMGQEAEKKRRLMAFSGFQVDMDMVKSAKKDVIVMHCLPAHRGEEITDEVMESGFSAVFDQAENRLHTQKAVMALLMGPEDPS